MKTIALVLVMSLVGFIAFGQSGPGVLPLDKLEPDLSTLFRGIGDDILVNMNQIAIAGDTIGDAELGSFPHLSIDLLGLGLTAFNGIGTILANPDTVWQFEALPLPDLIESALGGTGIYEATQSIFALPTLRGNFGFGIAGGIEVLGSISFLSDDLLFALAEPFVELPAAVTALDAQILNLRLTGRKVLISEAGLRPALSLGLGVTHGSTSIAYELESLAGLLGEPIDLLGSDLDITGAFSLKGSTTGFGVDLHLSKRLLFILVPFLKLSTWYHFSSYDVSADVTATQTVPGETEPYNSFDLSVAAANSARDLSIYLTTGLEIKLLVLVLHASLGLNLQGAALTIGEAFAGDFSSSDINNANVNLGLRIQI